jgi:hypothetical protein
MDPDPGGASGEFSRIRNIISPSGLPKKRAAVSHGPKGIYPYFIYDF